APLNTRQVIALSAPPLLSASCCAQPMTLMPGFALAGTSRPARRPTSEPFWMCVEPFTGNTKPFGFTSGENSLVLRAAVRDMAVPQSAGSWPRPCWVVERGAGVAGEVMRAAAALRGLRALGVLLLRLEVVLLGDAHVLGDHLLVVR